MKLMLLIETLIIIGYLIYSKIKGDATKEKLEITKIRLDTATAQINHMKRKYEDLLKRVVNNDGTMPGGTAVKSVDDL